MKIFAKFLVFVLLVQAVTLNVFAFKDVPEDEWYANFVEELVDIGIIDSTKDYFRPTDTLNRAEALKLVVEGCGNYGSAENEFIDVRSDDWFYNYVLIGLENKIVYGYREYVEGGYLVTFRPANNVTRAEFVKMIMFACDMPDVEPEYVLSFMAEDGGVLASGFSDISSDDWYYEVVLSAYAWDIIGGYDNGTFRPNDYVNRAEAALILLKVINPQPRE